MSVMDKGDIIINKVGNNSSLIKIFQGTLNLADKLNKRHGLKTTVFITHNLKMPSIRNPAGSIS